MNFRRILQAGINSETFNFQAEKGPRRSRANEKASILEAFVGNVQAYAGPAACMRTKPFTVIGEGTTGFRNADHRIAKWSAQRCTSLRLS